MYAKVKLSNFEHFRYIETQDVDKLTTIVS
jgi:hypothetical protein